MIILMIGEAKNPRTWLLKCPMHNIFLKELVMAFPDAQTILYI